MSKLYTLIQAKIGEVGGFARNRQVSLTQLINSYFLFEELPSFRLSIITGKQLLTYAFYPFNKFSALHVMI